MLRVLGLLVRQVGQARVVALGSTLVDFCSALAAKASRLQGRELRSSSVVTLLHEGCPG